MDIKKTYDVLFERAKYKHITYVEMAETLGITPKSFWRKRKTLRFTMKEFSDLCRMVDVNPAWLMLHADGKTRWNRKVEQNKDTSKEVEQ